ncbi:MAG TPA: hypothetical protein VHL09_01340 [Dehalococcoidia bacterium]|nr:hypothetical protein [Dehalococcoidia bacterium]
MTISELRIGLIADTHEADEAVRLAEELTRLDCHLYGHLGDVGGSREITAAVRQYKQYPESVADLPSESHAAFHEFRAKGLSELRAYLATVLSDRPEARLGRMAETRDNYEAIVGLLAGLPDALCISGNTDRVLMARNQSLVALFELTGLPFLVWPAWREVNGHLLVFWPSLDRAQVADARVGDFVDKVIDRAQRHESVVILAHEQLFKGPAPAAYRRNALARGHRPLTVPHYEPATSWPHLTRLLRGLPRSARIASLHGHVHDSNEVLGAGAPYLRCLPDGALGYRVPAGPEAPGRQIPSYSVPIEHLAVVTLRPDGYTFEAWRPDLQTRVNAGLRHAAAPTDASPLSVGEG